MKRTEKVAAKVQKLLPVEVQRVGDVLAPPIFGCVVNAVMIERTSIKDTVEVWQFNAGFFQKRERLGYSLSDRVYNVAGGRDSAFFSGTADEMAAQIAEALVESGLARQMQTPYTLRDFLGRHCPGGLSGHYDDAFVFDFCCATFLSGDVEAARAGMLHMREEWDRAAVENPGPHHPVIERRHREIVALAELVPGSDAAMRAHILGEVAENAALLGFSPTGL